MIQDAGLEQELRLSDSRKTTNLEIQGQNPQWSIESMSLRAKLVPHKYSVYMPSSSISERRRQLVCERTSLYRSIKIAMFTRKKT